MPNLVYYKDNSGVVRGPIHEDEATALLKANFFRPDHVFRVVDSNNAEEFTSIDDLRTLNGAETPFGTRGEENEDRELIRVYKELSTVLQERNETKAKAEKYEAARKLIIEQFNMTMKGSNSFSVETVDIDGHGGMMRRMMREASKSSLLKTRFTNNTTTSVRCLIDNSWDPIQAKVVGAGRNFNFENYKRYIFIAPHISDDPLDGSEYVSIFRNSETCNIVKFD